MLICSNFLIAGAVAGGVAGGAGGADSQSGACSALLSRLTLFETLLFQSLLPDINKFAS